MEIGCGGVGLRTSRGHVVNLYFWHMENEDGVCVRREDFLGRADSPRVKQELLRRMATYNRRMGETLASKVAKLEWSLTRVGRTREPSVGIVEDRRAKRSGERAALLFAGARGI